MKKWEEPRINIFSVKLDENIAASGDGAEYNTKWFWYTGQGWGNEKGGYYRYVQLANGQFEIQDTLVVSQQGNIQNKNHFNMIVSCKAE